MGLSRTDQPPHHDAPPPQPPPRTTTTTTTTTTKARPLYPPPSRKNIYNTAALFPCEREHTTMFMLGDNKASGPTIEEVPSGPLGALQLNASVFWQKYQKEVKFAYTMGFYGASVLAITYLGDQLAL